MARLLLLLGLISVGCGPQPGPEPCAQGNSGTQAPPILISLVGEVTEVELVLKPAVFCPRGNPVASDVVTEVLDALNQPVAHAHTEPTSSNTGGYSTRITFTPAAAGVHYLTARFEPALGIARRVEQVALERSAEPPWARATLGAPCDEVLPMGAAVLCRRGNQLELSRDGGVELREPVAGVATAGEVGWWWTSSRLSRVVERDGGLVRSDLSLSIGAGALAVTEERWLLGADAGFLEVRVDADGGLSPRQWSVDPAFAPIAGPGLALEGEVVGWSTASRVCAGAADAGVSCVDAALQPLAGDGRALWLRGVDTGAVAQARVSADGGVPVVLFVPAQSSALMDTRQTHPSFTWNGRLVVVRPDELSLDAWRAPGSVARQSVTAQAVVFQLQSGETVIFRR